MKKKQIEITEEDRRKSMESLDQLRKSLDGFSSEFSRLDLLVGTAENRITDLNSKRTLLEADVKALEEKRNTLDIQVKEERKSVIEQIEAKHAEARRAKEEADDIKKKAELRAAEVARKDMEVHALKEQYEAQLADLERQRESVNAKTKEVEEFLARIK